MAKVNFVLVFRAFIHCMYPPYYGCPVTRHGNRKDLLW